MIAVAKMRDEFVPADRMKAFNDFLRVTGAGDHPEFIRLMNNVARRLDEPAAPSVAYQPPANIGQRPSGAKRSALYDHPTSNGNRR